MKSFITKLLILIIFLTGISHIFADTSMFEDEPNSTDFLETEDLIFTASNKLENIDESPAVTIVLTRQDIKERGYTELTSVLTDLPGFHTVRPNGDTYFKTYLRGFRNNIGTPFILLVDGQYMNDIYYNSAEILKTIPMSNIERIEMVYGPASSIYGANALMGVLNVITTKPTNSNASGELFLGSISHDGTIGNIQEIIDFSFISKEAPIRFSVSGRSVFGVEDSSKYTEYEHTNPEYSYDRAIWGSALDLKGLIGHQSPIKTYALDSRLHLDKLEVGVHYYRMENGYGIEYPFNTIQPNAGWTEQEKNIYLKYSTPMYSQFLNEVNVTHLIRFRQSDVINSSYEVFNWGGYVGFDYFQALNNSLSIKSTADFSLTRDLDMVIGGSYANNNFQKDYDTVSSYAATTNPEDFDIEAPELLSPPPPYLIAGERDLSEDKSVFMLAKYNISDFVRLNKHSKQFGLINVGMRLDSNTNYGDYTTVRTSVVLDNGPLNFKMLYGNAVQSPANRLTWGGWASNQSSPDVKPEKAETIEFSLSYKRYQTQLLLSVYTVSMTDKLLNNASGAFNVGKGNVFGIDLHAKHEFNTLPSFLDFLVINSYVSYISGEEDSYNVNSNNELTYQGKKAIGDLAPLRFRGTLTAYYSTNFSSTLFSTLIWRYVSNIDDLYNTNPVDSIKSFSTFDLILGIESVIIDNFDLNFSIHNLFDETYFHPGIKTADAGLIPVATGDNGTLYENVRDARLYSSILPQPGRLFTLSATYNF
ncbi:hypothetical protein DID76_01450 [Candidatus Marinamargulisbacteria bacterium SCGC AG-414-C22]|nr:hypothetical protein DID76_01450 [Candidatus Marinamargulisbacteria bacterium SCGC AG-414-C22]